jgi:exopolysaccharide biosynthesis polyprenyl glycosylphosphotransferase
LNTTPLRRRLALWAFKLGEALLILVALGIAGMATSDTPPTLAGWWSQLSAAPAFTLAVLLAWHLVLMLRGLYASHRLEEPYRELLDLLGCVVIVVAIVTLAALFAQRRLANAEFVTAFWASLSLLALTERALLRGFLRRLHGHGRNLRFALIIGAGERAQRLAKALSQRGDLGYRLIGCVDDMRPTDVALLPWLGPLDDLSKVLSERVVDEVFMALPMRSSYERIQHAVSRCEEQGTLITMPTDFFAARLARTRIGQIGRQPVLYLSAVPENDWRLVAKRCIDFFGGLALLLVLSPVMLAVAVAIRMTSPGPVIFKQSRIGLNKRPFTLYKFRTMVRDAEARQAALESQNEASGPVFKIRKDPRITVIGGFLRRTSLDELPQLFNVLKGEMSLVGPRPLPLRDVEGFREDWQRRRFTMLPGITCLWQLSGRSNVSFEQWMELDLQYIDRWSLWLDIGILLKTAGVVLRREGAY